MAILGALMAATGNAQDALFSEAEAYERFMGRPPSLDALLARSGLEATT